MWKKHNNEYDKEIPSDLTAEQILIDRVTQDQLGCSIYWIRKI